jgi:hypothetical protein
MFPATKPQAWFTLPALTVALLPALWNASSVRAQTRTWKVADYSVPLDYALSPGGGVFVYHDALAQTLQGWDTSNGQRLWSARIPKRTVRRADMLSFSPDGRLLIAAQETAAHHPTFVLRETATGDWSCRSATSKRAP